MARRRDSSPEPSRVATCRRSSSPGGARLTASMGGRGAKSVGGVCATAGSAAGVGTDGTAAISDVAPIGVGEPVEAGASGMKAVTPESSGISASAAAAAARLRAHSACQARKGPRRSFSGRRSRSPR